ncbi:MAG: hypothetical protein ACI860_001436 [Chitinophagales bacterium]|jgi:hypothetical protein
MSQEKIKALMDKINLLMNVFMKDGLEKVSQLEKDLLKEQVNNLLQEVEALELKKNSTYTVNDAVEPKASIEKAAPPMEPVIQEVIAEQAEAVILENAPKVPDNKKETREFSAEKPHRSLKSVIDLNKSFILKAELFNKDNEAYNQFINDLAQVETEKESIHFIEKHGAENNWDEEDKAYELLQRAVEKRFLPLLQQ